jgi:hypothetical protein
MLFEIGNYVAKQFVFETNLSSRLEMMLEGIITDVYEANYAGERIEFINVDFFLYPIHINPIMQDKIKMVCQPYELIGISGRYSETIVKPNNMIEFKFLLDKNQAILLWGLILGNKQIQIEKAFMTNVQENFGILADFSTDLDSNLTDILVGHINHQVVNPKQFLEYLESETV